MKSAAFSRPRKCSGWHWPPMSTVNVKKVCWCWLTALFYWSTVDAVDACWRCWCYQCLISLRFSSRPENITILRMVLKKHLKDHTRKKLLLNVLITIFIKLIRSACNSAHRQSVYMIHVATILTLGFFKKLFSLFIYRNQVT